ncbi:GyrI-like domain-containing protein [Neolewinella aurantiaca]|uniref:GyrI-like domain-containing protein n=1 Tax=Neolewinella aurantiaca TaxID=2602767 RepID=A0A5C7FXH5_9BACT|nr:GyrI-like domain-containing protein [Neolewinella aurantiaca]TXF91179.1 GyrI-like domain-containing protein [Neolewinella aurantiaca]
MKHEILTLRPQKLVGHSRKMSMEQDQTSALFQRFMPVRNNVPGRTDAWVYDLRIYPENISFAEFGPATEFLKWAAVAVSDDCPGQEGFEIITIPGGLYACFHHKGPAADAPMVFGYILQHWLPSSGYSLDNRPHFDTMPEGYDPLSSDSEEKIWIPIKARKGDV